jgi:prevent-host-death family protein
MRTVSATEASRNFKMILNRVEFQHEELLIMRNNAPVARLIPGTTHMTAAEAFADLYCTVPPEAGESWLADGRLEDGGISEVRDPWES